VNFKIGIKQNLKSSSLVCNWLMLLSMQKTEKVFLLTMVMVISFKQLWLCSTTKKTVKA
jgi:hypothetical protein